MNLNHRNIFPAILFGLKELKLNPWTLSFSGVNKPLEKEFIAFYIREKLLQMRAAIIIGAILYALFGILDAFLLGDLKYTFWFIRFGLVIPFGTISLLFTYSKLFKNVSQIIIMLNNLVAGIGIIAMVVLAGPPVSYSYYAGLILVFIYIYTFSGLRYTWAVGTNWGIVILFEIFAVFLKKFPATVLISNSFFFVAANILSMIAAYFIEYSLRRDFYLAKLLEIEKEKVELSKKQLERLVMERTIQLSETNEELSKELLKKRKLIEKQKNLQEQLVQSQKMEAVGHLAGGVAHDFNNLLTIINGYSELILLNMKNNSKSFERMQQIIKAGKRAESLTRQLLAFSRKQILQPVVLDLNQLIKELEKMLRRLIGENIKLLFQYESDIFKIKADPGQLEQVIMNLVVNARDAMPKGGEIRIETQNIEAEDSLKQRPNGLSPGRKVLLTIRDTGTGIDKKILNHIFEPFFTTKAKGKGTGLGLSTVYGIVKQSDASIYVRSKKGKGTVFCVYFNTVEGDASDAIEIKSELKKLSGRETILVAEDEEAVREYVGVVLNKYGYNVILTSNGTEALNRIKNEMDKIDLLITDVIMPGLSGKDLVDKIMQYKPDLKYLYISGYTEDVIGQHGILDERIHIIQKPFTHRDFLEKIRSILN